MIIDTTLREGAQAHGIYFNEQDRITILRSLDAIGIADAEVGWAGQEELSDTLRLSAKTAPELHLAVWCRCRVEDLDVAASAGAVRVHIGVPASDAHREIRLGLNRGQLLVKVGKVLDHARERGFRHVTMGLEDAGRSDHAFLVELASKAALHGAHRLRCSDTVGLMTPDALVRLLPAVKSAFGGPVAVHCHNDLGLATANALAALDAGADAADASLLGLGERAGITRLEELAAALVILRGQSYNLAEARAACRRVAEVVRMSIPFHWPVAGERLFAVESGIHLHGIARAPSLFEPYPPELVGAARHLDAGAKCGAAGVAQLAARLGLALPDHDLQAYASAVRAKARSLGRPLTEEEFAQALATSPA